jgi:hypothetical protein
MSLHSSEGSDEDGSQQEGRTTHQRVRIENDRLRYCWKEIARKGNFYNNNRKTAEEFLEELSVGTGRDQRNKDAAAKKVGKLRHRYDAGKEEYDGRMEKKRKREVRIELSSN